MHQLLSVAAALGLAAALARLLPRSATAGETLLAAGAAAMALSRFLALLAAPAAAAAVEAACLALILAPLAAAAAAVACRRLGPSRQRAAAAAALLLSYAALQRVLAAPPLAWACAFAAAAPARRARLAAAAIALSALVLPLLRLAARRPGPRRRLLLRKAFHILVTAVLAPAALLDPPAGRLACALAFAALVGVEAARVTGLTVSGLRLGAMVQRVMGPFADERDSGCLLLSHFSLLLGCAGPLWIVPPAPLDAAPAPLAAWAGVLALGVGDAAAGAVGALAGRTRLLRGWPKTWEGTCAGALATFAVAAAAVAAGAPAGQAGGRAPWASIAAATVGASALEALTGQLDNAVVPLHYYALLVLACRG